MKTEEEETQVELFNKNEVRSESPRLRWLREKNVHVYRRTDTGPQRFCPDGWRDEMPPHPVVERLEWMAGLEDNIGDYVAVAVDRIFEDVVMSCDWGSYIREYLPMDAAAFGGSVDECCEKLSRQIKIDIWK